MRYPFLSGPRISITGTSSPQLLCGQQAGRPAERPLPHLQGSRMAVSRRLRAALRLALARELIGEGGLSFLRFALNVWAIGHHLHMEEVPCCLMACVDAYILAVCTVPAGAGVEQPRHFVRGALHVGARVAWTCATDARPRVDGARRVVMATTVYARCGRLQACQQQSGRLGARCANGHP